MLRKKGEYMTYICSVGQGIPKHAITQAKVKALVQEIFPFSERKISKLMPIFDNANIDERQLVVDQEWLKEDHTFQDKNNKYQTYALKYSLEAIDDCLKNESMLTKTIPYEAIDMIAFISSTGMATPSLDAYIMNERSFREDVVRMPLWGLGCGGGASGLGRAAEWLKAHPKKTALIICCELCSLTFQKKDLKMSNVVGTALFGDGVAAALMIGDQSPFLTYRRGVVPKVIHTSSYTKKESLHIMGWDITNHGLEVIFSKNIPKLIHSIWKDHIYSFFNENNIEKNDVHSFIAHPGGRKVLEAMEETLEIPKDKLIHSYDVLANHGNMSSATVLYVLREWLFEHVHREEKSILSSLGPGFTSELLLLEWD